MQRQLVAASNPASLAGTKPQVYKNTGGTNRYLQVFQPADSETNAQPAARRPNILLIITDDQGYGDLALHGNEQISTPALDRLGRESIRFDRFFVSPLCAPTRASLLTGRYSLRTASVASLKGRRRCVPKR